MRQITDRSVEAFRALEGAKRRAPFLTKWRHFPRLPESRHGGDWEVKQVAVSEWQTFLKQFSVVELGYEAVRLETVMNWYEHLRAPFRDGKKRKEFPDAFAIAALAGYAAETSTYVAVVSADEDFKLACDRFPYLLYFPSLPALTELLLGDTTAVDAVRNLVLAAQGLLEEAAAEEASSLNFYHAHSKYDDIDDIDIDYVTIGEVRIVGLGDRDCTVTFDAELHFSVELRWEEDHYYEEPERMSGHVSDYSEISGTAKLRLKSDRSGVEDVSFIEIDQSEVEITEEP
jgi:hypothetical protein